MPKILYFTDKAGVGGGYSAHYEALLVKAGISRADIMALSVYARIPKPMKWGGAGGKQLVIDEEQRPAIEAEIRRNLSLLRPQLGVASDPAVTSIITGGRSVEKARGGLFHWGGIPWIVTYPINAFHRKVEDKTGAGFADANDAPIYKVPSGRWILSMDWSKIGRYAAGKQRRLPKFTYTVVRSVADMRVAEKFLSECLLVAHDDETKVFGGHSQVTVHGYYGIHKDGRCHGFAVPWWDGYVDEGQHHFIWGLEDAEEIFLALQRIHAAPSVFAMHNGGYDSAYAIRDRVPVRNFLLDSMHLWHSLYPELPKTLDFVSSILCDNYSYWKDDRKGIEESKVGRRDQNMEGYWRYCVMDCYYTFWNCFYLLQILLATPWLQHNYKVEFLTMLSGLSMSMKGTRADKTRLWEHRERLEAETLAAITDLRIMTDDPAFNPNSPDQVKQFLYDTLGAGKRKVKGKEGATDELTLKQIRLEHPIYAIFIDQLWDTKKPAKQISNICDVTMRTNRLRSAFSPVTETWRFNSKGSAFWDGTNVQNITVKMRDWLVADDGYLLFDFDYSQSDAVFMAYESGDPRYIETMDGIHKGIDSHAIHAELFFKVPYDRIVAGKKAKDPFVVHPTKGVRNLAKRVVHGSNFQMAAQTLYLTMGREEVIAAAKALGHADADSWSINRLIGLCDLLLKAFHSRYPGLGVFFKDIARQLKQNGYLVNAFGMHRTVMGDVNDSATQREAAAFFGQGDTAGNMNRCFLEMDHGLILPDFRDGPNPHRHHKPLQILSQEWHAERGVAFAREEAPMMMLKQVHDSFVGQVRIDVAKEMLNNLLTVMERPFIIGGRETFIKAEGAVGLRWGESMKGYDPKDPHSLDRITVSSNLQVA